MQFYIDLIVGILNVLFGALAFHHELYCWKSLTPRWKWIKLVIGSICLYFSVSYGLVVILMLLGYDTLNFRTTFIRPAITALLSAIWVGAMLRKSLCK